MSQSTRDTASTGYAATLIPPRLTRSPFREAPPFEARAPSPDRTGSSRPHSKGGSRPPVPYDPPRPRSNTSDGGRYSRSATPVGQASYHSTDLRPDDILTYPTNPPSLSRPGGASPATRGHSLTSTSRAGSTTPQGIPRFPPSSSDHRASYPPGDIVVDFSAYEPPRPRSTTPSGGRRLGPQPFTPFPQASSHSTDPRRDDIQVHPGNPYSSSWSKSGSAYPSQPFASTSGRTSRQESRPRTPSSQYLQFQPTHYTGGSYSPAKFQPRRRGSVSHRLENLAISGEDKEEKKEEEERNDRL